MTDRHSRVERLENETEIRNIIVKMMAKSLAYVQ